VRASSGLPLRPAACCALTRARGAQTDIKWTPGDDKPNAPFSKVPSACDLHACACAHSHPAHARAPCACLCGRHAPPAQCGADPRCAARSVPAMSKRAPRAATPTRRSLSPGAWPPWRRPSRAPSLRTRGRRLNVRLRPRWGTGSWASAASCAKVRGWTSCIASEREGERRYTHKMTSVYMHVCMYVCMHACMFFCMYVCAYLCVCMHM